MGVVRTAACIMLLALGTLAPRGVRGARIADLNGAWRGSIAGPATGSARATVTQHGGRLAGSMALDVGAVHGTFTLGGRAHGGTIRLRGRQGRLRLGWRGAPDADPSTWTGPLLVRGAGKRVRGVLTLAREANGGTQCGDAFFASDVMPRVLEPICSQCHVEGGLASSAPFRVTVGDPVATSLSALREVNAGDPMQSKILRKPLGDLPHGGGRRIEPGSAEEQVLVEWVTLVTAPGCDATGGGPGNPGPPPGTGAALYADNCASCHGPDARGLDGRPDVHCSRSIHDSVRNGRTGPSGTMPAFSNLSDADIGKIQDFLVGLCPATSVTGAELWAGNCAVCHGADAGGAGVAPNVRCATRVADAITVGRAAAMPAIPALQPVEIDRLVAWLDGECTAHGRTGADLYAGNCSTCHGATAHGGRNALGVPGSDIACTESGDFQEKVSSGGDGMPAFPALTPGDVSAIVDWVRGTFCSGG